MGKNIRELALTTYYPYGKNKERIKAERTQAVDKALDEYEAQIRAEVIAEISREMRLLYGNEYEKKIRAKAITECLQIIQKIKDDYNDAKFGEQIPINYGTLCGIIIEFRRLLKGAKE